MAKLYAKLTSNSKPSRSITSEDIIKVELNHKNRLTHTIYYRIDNGEAILEIESQTLPLYRYKEVKVIKEQKPKVIKCPYCMDYPCSDHDGSKYE